ncbi:DNA alkylation repair protein [Vaginisenegalia massiliensis]|uniref:DNA alkylation repair protein n=1 Tax=Vaginisenegalia massiliensis TaxID=2058294 RepID=UPI000F537AF0|nr:DNA alkylation repair protein [Vaginisenegalia massiliensis]
MNHQSFINEIKAQANLDLQEPMAAYLRHQFSFLGLKAPQRKALQKAYLQQLKRTKEIDWDFVNLLWAQDQREFQYIACDYLTSMRRYHQLSDLDQYQYFIQKKSWWDSVDSMVKNVGYISQIDSAAKKQILSWAEDRNLWLRRAAILHQLGLKERTDKAFLAKIILMNINSQEFFINKAIGWSLREFAKTDSEWVNTFLIDHKAQLAPLAYREASKHLTLD